MGLERGSSTGGALEVSLWHSGQCRIESAAVRKCSTLWHVETHKGGQREKPDDERIYSTIFELFFKRGRFNWMLCELDAGLGAELDAKLKH